MGMNTADADLLHPLACQIFGPELVPLVQKQVEAFVVERDRHKHRAAAEVISGMVRGAKHWPLAAHDTLWQWLSGLIPRIFEEATPDSQPAWQMCVEYMLQHRDPRRARPLIDYLTQTAKESIGRDGGSPWEQAKAQSMLRGALLALDTKFSPWAQQFVDLYEQHFAHDFAEVRLLVSESLADLELLRVHPSFGSVSLFLADCDTHAGSLLARPESYRIRLKWLSERLAQWRTERVPTSQGTSA